MPNPEDEKWRDIFLGNDAFLAGLRNYYWWWPGAPRCILCDAPLGGIGGAYLYYFKRIGRNERNPKYCNACDGFIKGNNGGATVELSMAIVDIRNSVALSAGRDPIETHRMRRDFYDMATIPIVDTDGLIHELTGDSAFGVFPSGFCGPQHVSKAVEAARMLLRSAPSTAPDGKPVAYGIGVHTGPVYIGKFSPKKLEIDYVAMHRQATAERGSDIDFWLISIEAACRFLSDDNRLCGFCRHRLLSPRRPPSEGRAVITPDWSALARKQEE